MVVRASDLSDREREPFARLRVKAAEIRKQYIDKPVGKGNVAVLEYVPSTLEKPVTVGATSRPRSPSPKPLPRSMGGYFEPSIDPSDPRRETPMDTDAEYKALSELAQLLDAMVVMQRIGVVYLFTEYQPCRSCESVLAQFEEIFPQVTIFLDFDRRFP